jgi:hypothetical protein
VNKKHYIHVKRGTAAGGGGGLSNYGVGFDHEMHLTSRSSVAVLHCVILMLGLLLFCRLLDPASTVTDVIGISSSCGAAGYNNRSLTHALTHVCDRLIPTTNADVCILSCIARVLCVSLAHKEC